MKNHGVMLALAYLVYERLWFPIGLHLAWNIFSGPILGYDISGYIPAESVLALRGNGRSWLTGPPRKPVRPPRAADRCREAMPVRP